MYKQLIAATVVTGLGFSTVVSADVKFIGKMQMELVSTSSDTQVDGLSLDDGATSAIGGGSASYIGVAGSHDLGNNMTGLYKVRFAYSAETGDTGGGNALKQKDAFLGLKSEFGTLLAGRMSTPYKTSTLKWDVFATTFLQARGSNGMSALHSSEVTNALAYANRFGEVSFVGAVALDEVGSDDVITASLNMPVSDSLDLALAFLKDEAGATSATASKVAVKWTGDGRGAVLQYESLDAGLGGIDVDSATVGVQSADESQVFASYHVELDEDTTVAISYGMHDSDAAVAKDGSYVAVGVKNSMSKYVSAHAGWKTMSDGVAGPTTAGDTTFVGAGLIVVF